MDKNQLKAFVMVMMSQKMSRPFRYKELESLGKKADQIIKFAAQGDKDDEEKPKSEAFQIG